MFAARRPRVLGFAVALALAVTAPAFAEPGVAAAESPAPAEQVVVGQLVQAWPEYEDHGEAAERGSHGPLSFVRTAKGDSVRVDTDDVEDVPLGATVEVTVGRAITDDASAEDGYEKAREVLDTEVLALAPATTSPGATPVNHPVSVVMVVPAGGTRDSTTLADVVDLVNGPVADFWAQETDGAINFGVTGQRDWVDLTVGCDDPYALWQAAARAVGFTPGQRKHLLVYVSNTPEDLPGCSDGLGEVGWSKDTGGYSYVRYAMPSIVAHELGHNLGLGHSSLMQCDGALNAAPCQVTPYLDLYDVMGASWDQLGSLSLAQAALLVPIPHSQAFDPQTAPATVTLAPVSQRSGVRGIALRSDLRTKHWVEFRPPSGRDAWLGTTENQAGLESGVLVRSQARGNDTSLLLDGSPSPRAGWRNDLDVALPLNTPVRVDDLPGRNGAFFLTVTDLDPSGATVEVLPKTAITMRYEASGGATGPLGPPTAEESCGGVNWIDHCSRSFQNGIITWNYGSAARVVHGEIYAAWEAGGGFGPTMGRPLGDPVCGLTQGGCRQSFVNATIAWSPAAGAFVMRKAARYWHQNGAETGLLGYPTGAEACVGDSCEQPFQGGTVVIDPVLGTLTVQGQLRDAWVAAGGRSSSLGLPSAAMACGLVRGGCFQRFEGGWLYWSAPSGARAVSPRMMTAWAAQAWEGGPLGYPTEGETCGLAGGGCRQSFEGGTVAWSPGTGARAVIGAMATTWAADGRESGLLGYPVAARVCGLAEAGCLQRFQGGTVYSSPSTGAHAVPAGPVAAAWGAQRWEAGSLGYPVAGQVCGLVDGACRQAFQGGTIYAGTSTGTRVVSGAIGRAWTAQGAETGRLGHPTSAQLCGLASGGCSQHFSGGSIHSSPASGAHPVLAGPIAVLWGAQRWEGGPLGYPTASQVCGLVGGGCLQSFQGGTVYSSDAAGTHAVPRGAVASLWAAQGWEAGPLGYPTGGQRCGGTTVGCVQVFQGGHVSTSTATGSHVVPTGPIADAWAAQGSESGPLGRPAGAPHCGLTGGGCLQTFQGGTLYSAATAGTHAVLRGAIAAHWASRGWEAGPLGYPVGAQRCAPAGGACVQAFQGGLVSTSTATGSHTVPSGPIADAWSEQGRTQGPMGAAAGAQYCGLVGGGCLQSFAGGTMYWAADTGSHAVPRGPIATYWGARGWEAGPLGYPTGAQRCGLVRGGCVQTFQGGSVYRSDSTAAQLVPTGPIADAWAADGWENGALGYPTGAQFCGLVGGGCLQSFSGGTMYSAAGTGAYAVPRGPIATHWAGQRWEAGPLGYPVGAQVCGLVAGGCVQAFQGGRVYRSAGTPAQTVPAGPIADAWDAQAAEAGPLGYPTGEQRCGLVRGGCLQGFQGGTIYSTTATGAHSVSGPIAAYWAGQRWEAGPLGYPTSAAYAVTGGTAQDFEGGVLTYDTATGRVGPA